MAEEAEATPTICFSPGCALAIVASGHATVCLHRWLSDATLFRSCDPAGVAAKVAARSGPAESGLASTAPPRTGLACRPAIAASFSTEDPAWEEEATEAKTTPWVKLVKAREVMVVKASWHMGQERAEKRGLQDVEDQGIRKSTFSIAVNDAALLNLIK